MGQRSKLELALALAVASSAAMPLATAEAQGFYADRADMEGPGFKVGRLVLHPGLALSGGYDSNVFLLASDEQPSFILRLAGYLDVATEGAVRRSEGDAKAKQPQKVEFRAGLGGFYYYFYDERVPGAVGADAHVDFAYNPSKVFSLVIWDNFIRTVRPFANPNTASGPTMSYGRNINRATLQLVGRSKSQVLEGRLGYTSTIEAFDAALYAYGKNLRHSVPASLTWNFFPTSALVYDVIYIHQQYRNPAAVEASPSLLSNSNSVSNLVGYNGAITERLSLTAMIGYAAGFFTIGQSFDDVIARIEARWQVRPNIVLTSGYNRLIQPSFIGNYYLMDRLHLNTSFIIRGAFRFGTTAWLSFYETGLALNPDGSLLGNQPSRQGIRVNATLFGEYRLKSWLALFGDFGYLADFTDFQYAGTGVLLVPDARYQRFEGWLGIRVFY